MDERVDGESVMQDVGDGERNEGSGRTFSAANGHVAQIAKGLHEVHAEQWIPG